MRFSDDKTNHLSHALFKSLDDYPEVDFEVENNEVRLMIKEALVDSLQTFDNLEEKVRKNLLSRSQKMIEGSREWDIEYSKIYEEEIQKLKGV